MSWGGGWGGACRPWGCCGGWYGGGYRGPVVINIGNNINVGNRTDIGNRIERNTNLNRDRSRANLYNRPETRDRLADRETAMRNLNRARPATSHENTVFADRDGNVARQVGNDWQAREVAFTTRFLGASVRPRNRVIHQVLPDRLQGWVATFAQVVEGQLGHNIRADPGPFVVRDEPVLEPSAGDAARQTAVGQPEMRVLTVELRTRPGGLANKNGIRVELDHGRQQHGC